MSGIDLKKETIVKQLLEWHKYNRRHFPWRDEPTPYRVFVAEFLLQRTPADRVAKIYEELVSRFPDPNTLSNASLHQLIPFAQYLGLKKRIKWLLLAMKIIHEKYKDSIPSTYEELIQLPGVGDYTASAILCFAFNKHVPVVDANVVRVISRLFGIKGRDKIEKRIIKDILTTLCPMDAPVKFYECLLDLAATICKKKPDCERCPLSQVCDYKQKSRTSF